MFAPAPAEPVFTDERRTVKADVPDFLDCDLLAAEVFCTLRAVFVGGGGGAGGGTGSGIFGADVHIINLYLGCFRFVAYVGF